MAVTVADLEALLASSKTADAFIFELIDDAENHYRMNGQIAFAKTMRSHWKLHLAKFWAGYKASEITTSRQREYQQKRLLQGAAKATINREMTMLAIALRMGYENEPRKVSTVPKMLHFAENNARKVFVSGEQLSSIREQARLKYAHQPWVSVLIELAYFLGWRQGELLGLRVKNVDLVSRCIRLDKTKNGDPREIPLTKNLVELVEPLIDGRSPDTRLFPICPSGLWRKWQELMTAAGCPDIHFHDFRRTSARTKVQAGVPQHIVMGMQGWKSDSIFRRYAIVAREDMLAALKKVEKLK